MYSAAIDLARCLEPLNTLAGSSRGWGGVPRTVANVSYDFSGAVVIVTGTARGQGRAHALGFAAAGANVALLDVAEPNLPTVPYSTASDADLMETADLVRSYGVRSLPIKCDVRASAQVSAAIHESSPTTATGRR
jgi:NAD(P)-dependent dehydrogenase (short-subunit alcohol dehydrogenase family)